MQNTSPIFSAPVSEAGLKPFRRVKLLALGAAYAGIGEAAVGTLLPSDVGGDDAAAIQGLEFGLHFAEMGNATDIAIGDELEAGANGTVVSSRSLGIWVRNCSSRTGSSTQNGRCGSIRRQTSTASWKSNFWCRSIIQLPSGPTPSRICSTASMIRRIRDRVSNTEPPRPP